ncbi:MAG: 3-phosphoshikimate 1-carboxyvinyltransferase [Flavobacteriales bacterium]|nr:3-phosphoshikimate 1-carboxyvinyltransferase [Flavobacteriales bacterium]
MGRIDKVGLEFESSPKGVVQINLPASKSISNRALVIQKLSEGTIEITNLSEAEDTAVLKSAFHKDHGDLWMNDAGTASRFSIAYAAVSPGIRVIKGSERLSQRPMGELINTLRSLGARIECLKREGRLPVKIEGRELQGGEVEIDAHVSSQFISALMMIAPKMKRGLKVNFRTKPTSKPYLYITKNVMEMCGAEVEIGDTFVQIKPTPYSDGKIDVEADWSAASYFFSAVKMNPYLQIFMPFLREKSIQGDSELINLYAPFGVKSTFQEGGLLLMCDENAFPSNQMDLKDTPDLAQTIAVTYAGLGLEVNLTGLHTLKVKETDRIEALVAELKKFGIHSSGTENSLFVNPSALTEPRKAVATYRDHRMAMAFAPLAFKFPIEIENPDVVSKSFPTFFQEFKKLGFRIS